MPIYEFKCLKCGKITERFERKRLPYNEVMKFKCECSMPDKLSPIEGMGCTCVGDEHTLGEKMCDRCESAYTEHKHIMSAHSRHSSWEVGNG